MTDKTIFCTGKNYPMQVGYNVKKCTAKDCHYRTPTTRHIQELSDLAKPIQEFLLKNYPTPSAVVISNDSAYVLESQMFVPLEIIEDVAKEALKEQRNDR